MADTAFLKKTYEGLTDVKLLYNPTRKEIDTMLTENPTESVMMLGHGSPNGLFGTGWRGNAIDQSNAHLLKNRDCIGIWCYAKRFAEEYGLRGYFTDMFISNKGEANSHGYKDATEEDIFAEVEFFATAVNTLIKDERPLTEWVGVLNSIADKTKGFVKFNYDAMAYYDGTQSAFMDSLIASWFEDYCYENHISGEWAKNIAYPIFVAGWKSCEKSYEE